MTSVFQLRLSEGWCPRLGHGQLQPRGRAGYCPECDGLWRELEPIAHPRSLRFTAERPDPARDVVHSVDQLVNLDHLRVFGSPGLARAVHRAHRQLGDTART